jgi:hypothetical protein
VAEIEDGFFVCERCGKVKPIASACSCGGEGHGQGEGLVPEGWDPELTRGDRPRLSIVVRPEKSD